MDNSFVTLQNKSIDIPLKIHDKEKDVIDIHILQAPKFGDLAIKDVNTKTLTHTLQSNCIGYDNFIFIGNDDKVPSNNATISITIASLPPKLTTPNSGSNSNGSITLSPNTK
jgi:hypothetical protein